MSKRVAEVIADVFPPNKRHRGDSTMEAPKNSKKLVISLRSAPALSADFEQKRWSALKDAVRAIHASQKTEWTLQELYSAVEDLVNHGRAAWLYSVLEAELTNHVAHLREKAQSLLASEPGLFLTQFNTLWQSYTEQIILIRQVFLVLDRRFAITSPAYRAIWELALHLFSTIVFGEERIKEHLTRSLLLTIEEDRNRQPVDYALLRNLIRMLRSLRLYDTMLEKPLLEDTRRFYSQKSEAYLSEHSVAEYISYVNELIRLEQTRCQTLFEPSTTRNVMDALYETAVQAHVSTLISKGLDGLLDNAALPDLAILYNLLERVGSLGELTSAWNSYIKRKGAVIVEDTQRDAHLVEDLLAFKLRLDSVLEGPFKRLDAIAYSQKEAMEHVVNLRTNAVAELLAKFIDAKLKSGKASRSVTEADLEPMLDRLLILFRYISSKDVFEAFYKKDLAKRLLLNKSLSIDVEKLMISKLKTECGANYTSKLEGMFKDMELSEDFNSRFKKSPQYAPLASKRIDSRVLVLTTGFWPTYTSNSNALLPQMLLDHQTAFATFYATQYAGRRLQWQHSLSHCVVRAQFQQRLELHMSLYQTIALLCFEHDPSSPAPVHMIRHLLQRTQMERGELVRTVKSLSRKQLPLLIRASDEPSGDGSDEKDDAQFTLNQEFRSRTTRVHVNALQVKENTEERAKTNEGVTKERVYALDAAIVRVMKARKTLSHSELVQEIVRALSGRFTPQPSDIKARVESLMEREYLKRDDSHPSIFHYLA